MKKIILYNVLCLCVLFNTGCGAISVAAVYDEMTPTYKPSSPTIEMVNTPVIEITATAVSTVAPATEVVHTVPGVTQTIEPLFREERAKTKIRSLMIEYNHVDEYFLSDEYWNRLYGRISKYGTAKRIVPLEFHSDSYDMYEGVYTMTTESFREQADYLMSNDYHFLTIHEIQGFVYGWLELPKRSIILTSDPGPGSRPFESISRITGVFSELESTYGYKPHINIFLVTQGLTEEENYNCKDNICWQSYVNAVESGYFSLGTHTQFHNHHDQTSENVAREDITISVDNIKKNTGIRVYAISWPYELCSPHIEMLGDIGITIGFGGWSRSTGTNYVYSQDNLQLCLPRLFPQNPDGFSGRPKGLTLEEMLAQAALDENK
ncbi:hypothetical protein A2V49_01505 [candidate division WWE3 bacterium RBG_19FT_COMBO_34_6]|uniref:NodB homology domain-containing protein n=1 Tax=candidate division WWE3 bacterium RBG_19FT_COMBO_34_6 TaxID=1802612 RepID=A0A1F4UJV0_UNCKA|nr:MAG: hypothetical protein A2V49_01505 [candidate division WWE3 bacterium RBG_19FT_COMBO_34_6]